MVLFISLTYGCVSMLCVTIVVLSLAMFCSWTWMYPLFLTCLFSTGLSSASQWLLVGNLGIDKICRDEHNIFEGLLPSSLQPIGRIGMGRIKNGSMATVKKLAGK